MYNGLHDELLLDLLRNGSSQVSKRWPQLRVLALAHTALEAGNRTKGHICAFTAERSEASAPVKVVCLPPALTQPWMRVDRIKGELLDVQAYLEVLEDADTDR